MTRSSILGLSLAVTLVSFTTASFAAGGAAEIFTAANHAKLAADAANINGVHMHLHHAVNCLVGPGGTGFDASEANPCAGGNGAMNDMPDATPAQKASMQAALDKALAGIAEMDLAKAKTLAGETLQSLQAVKAQ